VERRRTRSRCGIFRVPGLEFPPRRATSTPHPSAPAAGRRSTARRECAKRPGVGPLELVGVRSGTLAEEAGARPEQPGEQQQSGNAASRVQADVLTPPRNCWASNFLAIGVRPSAEGCAGVERPPGQVYGFGIGAGDYSWAGAPHGHRRGPGLPPIGGGHSPSVLEACHPSVPAVPPSRIRAEACHRLGAGGVPPIGAGGVPEAARRPADAAGNRSYSEQCCDDQLDGLGRPRPTGGDSATAQAVRPSGPSALWGVLRPREAQALRPHPGRPPSPASPPESQYRGPTLLPAAGRRTANPTPRRAKTARLGQAITAGRVGKAAGIHRRLGVLRPDALDVLPVNLRRPHPQPRDWLAASGRRG
jgi:hypothetical protein